MHLARGDGASHVQHAKGNNDRIKALHRGSIRVILPSYPLHLPPANPTSNHSGCFVMAGGVFGIDGLTIGGLGIWGILLMLVGGIAVWWVRGMPERKRAENEAIPVESEAMNILFKNMQAEIRRMGERVGKLEKRITVLEEENRALVRERDAALADNARLRAVNQGQGEMRQRAATIVAVERMQDRKAGGKP